MDALDLRQWALCADILAHCGEEVTRHARRAAMHGHLDARRDLQEAQAALARAQATIDRMLEIVGRG